MCFGSGFGRCDCVFFCLFLISVVFDSSFVFVEVFGPQCFGTPCGAKNINLFEKLQNNHWHKQKINFVVRWFGFLWFVFCVFFVCVLFCVFLFLVSLCLTWFSLDFCGRDVFSHGCLGPEKWAAETVEMSVWKLKKSRKQQVTKNRSRKQKARNKWREKKERKTDQEK